MRLEREGRRHDREPLVADDRIPSQTNLRKTRRVYWRINHSRDETGFTDIRTKYSNILFYVSITVPDHFLHKVGDLAVGKPQSLTVLQTETKELHLKKSPERHLEWSNLGPLLTPCKSQSEDGSSQLREEQFSQTHEGIPAMTLGGSHCGLRSHHNLNLPESLAFVEHLCTLPMLDIFLPTLLQ